MADRYVGEGGDDSKSGADWPRRCATINGALSKPIGPEDRIYVGPGVYRERVSLTDSGKLITQANRVDVTEGSTIVVANGVDFLVEGVEVGDQFMLQWLHGGGNAVGNGAGQVTCAGENFYTECVGFCINIHSVGAYLIATVVGGPPSAIITVTDINGVGWPPAGPNSFWVPSGEGSYEILGVTATQLTLDRPWSGPTYPGCAYYAIWRPIYLIGDETGEHTDGIGGVCRITGSDDDQSSARGTGIRNNGQEFWVIKGFQIDSCGTRSVHLDGMDFVVLEDIRSLSAGDTVGEEHFYFEGDINWATVRRCAFFGGERSWGINVSMSSIRWERALVIENCYAACYRPFHVNRLNNVVIKNCTSGMNCESFLYVDNMSTGSSVFIYNCEVHYANNVGIWATTNGWIVANWINYWDNNVDFFNVGTTGATIYQDLYLYLPDLPLLLDGYRYPVRFYPPSEWWFCRGIQGLYQANQDIYGVPRPTTDTKQSYGFQQEHHIERDTTITYGGEAASLKHVDARTTQFRMAISGNHIQVIVWVYREANYAGVLPKLVVWQPGGIVMEDIATGVADAWESLSLIYDPDLTPPYIWVELVSDNTATSGNYAVYWQQIRTQS